MADLLKVVLLEERVGLAVGEALAAADDGVAVGRFLEAAFFVKDEEDGLAEAVLSLNQRTEAIGQFLRQHRHDGADEVG